VGPMTERAHGVGEDRRAASVRALDAGVQDLVAAGTGYSVRDSRHGVLAGPLSTEYILHLCPRSLSFVDSSDEFRPSGRRREL
jgi:hypothetical protein